MTSLAVSLALAPISERKRILESLSPQECEELLHDWKFWARDEQLPPGGLWTNWIYLAGRGSGKTRAGAEWVRAKIKAGVKHFGIIAPTANDMRNVIITGPSGLLNVCWEGDRMDDGTPLGSPHYASSTRQITWPAVGARALLFSAEEPERLRGPQFEALWCDEFAAWKYPSETWDMAMFGLRLGENPQVMITTTPRPLPILRELLRSSRTRVTRGSSETNRANLSPAYFTAIVEKYQGTRLGRQELQGELIDEVDGALWNHKLIDATRITSESGFPSMRKIVVAIDPQVGEVPMNFRKTLRDTESKTDENGRGQTGIVICGIDGLGKGYVLADYSGRYSPNEWVSKAMTAFEKFDADLIVAEANQGGALVKHTLRTMWESVPIKIVHASRGKQARAEPVAALNEQGKIHHVGVFQELEDQMCTWSPEDGQSPDRLDALVWAFTELMVGTMKIPKIGGPIRVPIAAPINMNERPFGYGEY